MTVMPKFGRIAVMLLIIWLTGSATVQAQPNRYGVPIISNYRHSVTGGSEQNWSITQDARGVIYVGNNDKGVLEYDGVGWRSIPVPNNPIIRSLVTGDDGVVYVGAESEFGYLAPDGTGQMGYHSLSDSIDRSRFPFTGVWKTYYRNGKVYFCTFATIFIYDPASGGMAYQETSEYAFFSFFVDSTLYLSDFGSGLMRYNGRAFETVPGGEALREMSVTGMESYDSTTLLISTNHNGLFLYHTDRGWVDPSFGDPELQQYLREAAVTQIVPVGNDFAVATQYAGVVIIDREGNAREMITEAEGLIDQTISCIYVDRRKGREGPIWIANFMGVSKLESGNPFRMFTEASGFDGFVTDVKFFNGRLFVSTFSGLYYKQSGPTSTRFVPVPDIQGEDIRHLQLFRPSRGEEMLIASSEGTTWIIDRRMHISILKDQVINPSVSRERAEEYSGQYLTQDPARPNIIYTGRNDLVGLEYSRRGWNEVMRTELGEEGFFRMEVDRFGFLWTTTPRRVVRVDVSRLSDVTLKFLSTENGLPANEKNQVFLDPDSETVLIGTQDGFYRYDYFRDTVYRDTLLNRVLPRGRNLVHVFYRDRDGDCWLSFENEFSGWTEMVVREESDGFRILWDKPFRRLPDVSADLFYSDPEGGVWFGKSNELYYFDKDFSRRDTFPFQTLIREVSLGNDSILFHGSNFYSDKQGRYHLAPAQERETDPSVKFRYNNIEFRWAATFFEQEEAMEYSYMLEGFNRDWSAWGPASYKDFTNLPQGRYTLRLKARNVYGEEGLAASYAFTILRPWYASIPAFFIYVVLAVLLVYLMVKLYTRRLKRENLRLEGIIAERTAEIRRQKEELTDSIEYASRIQRALLPSDRLMDEYRMEHFILFRPRDIVSGDFYWMAEKKGKLIIVVADCTGHGVPGAFMSMLGMTFLDEIVSKSEVTDTSAILDQLRNHVISSLKQSGKTIKESTKDGMDLSLISIDTQTNELQISGAYNPIYLVRQLSESERKKVAKGGDLELPRGSVHDDHHMLIQVKADQMPIGISEKNVPFSSATYPYEGYSIYMFTDGFIDQFGGERGKKFMSRNFKKMILELQSFPLKEQGAAMETILLNWMGSISQIDDILVMGMKITPQ